MVIDPELRQSIVDLGMVRSIEQPAPGRVDVVVSLTTPGCPIRSHFQKGVTDAVASLEGVQLVNVGFDVLSQDEKQGLQQRLGRQGGLPTGALAQVKNVVCVGSGKGGVGKSTITANLAAALTAEGKPAAAMSLRPVATRLRELLDHILSPEENVGFSPCRAYLQEAARSRRPSTSRTQIWTRSSP